MKKILGVGIILMSIVICYSFSLPRVIPVSGSYDNGSKEFMGYTYLGMKIGHWTYWYKNGQKAKEGFWRLDDYMESTLTINVDSLYSSLITPDDDRNLFLQITTDTNNNTTVVVLNELWSRGWYENGRVEKDFMYDSLSGITKQYTYRNDSVGTISSVIEYKKGKRIY